jgi:uncharacterized protein (TIGR03435 family)
MKVAVAFGFALAIAAVSAQEPAAQLRFDVASVKQHQERVDPLAGGRRGGMCMGTDSVVVATGNLTIGPNGVVSNTTTAAPFSPGTCSFARTTLDEVIAEAYGVPRADVDRLIVGGPAWLRQDRFDIEARADKPRSRADLGRMLQTLLADRFGLRVHRETRELDGFALQTVEGRHKLPLAADAAATGTRWSAGALTATAVPMTRFADFLQRGLAKPVVDQTGLTGRYTFTLTWTPADGEQFVPAGVAAAFPAVSPTPPVGNGTGPALFTALQEQLGLRLRPQKVPLAVLVIDAVNHPSPN